MLGAAGTTAVGNVIKGIGAGKALVKLLKLVLVDLLVVVVKDGFKVEALMILPK